MAEPLIFDTSIWIHFLNGTSSPGKTLLEMYMDADSPIVLTPTIIHEILQGIREDTQYERVKENLQAYIVLSIDPIQAAIGAAELYRKLRKKGITIRKANDCLIGYYAIHHRLTIIHNDFDFDLMGEHAMVQVRRV
jgi:predicted nucleic acid-binding protein